MCEKQNELEKLNANIIIISFGTLPAVQQWLKDTCPHFTVLLDQDKSVYKSYNLEHSYWKSRTLKTRWYYFKAWLQGKKSRNYAAEHEDTSQLGGDFIVDKNGIIQFAYPSHDPTDRPAVEKLLKVLRSIDR